MIYKLKFLPIALKEWGKLDNSIKKQFKKKLEEIIKNPKIKPNRLRKFENHYKVKLKTSGYRLVYEVIEKEVVVLVIAVGKRDSNKIYEIAKLRT